METFASGDLVLDVVDGGPADGEVVVLLHGFPQDASAWDLVTPHLHEAGLRTLAPHQRGYSPGARPRRARDYRLPDLVGDVLALLDAAGVQRAHVVGHDWGGGVAWALAQGHPERVASLVVLSTPHLDALRWALRRGDQARRSWYVLGLQLPVVPEVLLARMLRRGDLRRTGLPEECCRRYAARLGRPALLRGPVNWYRAPLRRAGRRGNRPAGVPRPAGSRTVTVPTTYLWGNRDPFLGRAAAERTAEHVTGHYLFLEVDAGHWLPERQAELVARAVIERAGVAGPCDTGATHLR
ncbi:alpha/beta fold hydrolase [Ornithinimicrobium pekingense]|uniref:Alpha/beta hydrolase n=1 Tax=Ornithinimicrobium pekingense TaxID=384677 RepID=A0ABQ2FB06_9MICO|nr:alpha/beta fold hydrolase [Ornithinimicrobium pekingense]GGK70034.1 alpha/beta hydrolase [Ornithinimicrobium pekingense]